VNPSSHSADPGPTPKDHSPARQEIRGIPAFSAENGIRYSGGLSFRVGRADETARTGGVSHLVEHLALFGLGPHQRYSYNGSVSQLFTSFVATGTPDEVGSFLTELGRSLRELPMQRLQDEARVPRTEAARKSSHPVQQMLWRRFGAGGHGLALLPEYGLANPDPKAVSAWAEGRFTADNAALWFTGPPPPGLELDLSPGKRIETPAAVPLADLKLPAWTHWQQNLVAISFVVPRGAMLNLLLSLAARRITTKLRYEKGISYEIGIGYEPITRDEAHGTLWASCLPEHARTVRDGIVQVFDDLAANGATADELKDTKEASLRSWNDPESIPQEVYRFALDHLLGFESSSVAEIADEFGHIDGPESARRIASAQATSILFLPSTCPPSDGRFKLPDGSASAVTGTTFRHVTARYPWSKGERLVVGKEGVSIVTVEGRPYTILFASCVVAVDHKSGKLELFADRGTWLVIDPIKWRRGKDAVDMLRRALPRDLLVRVL
jgi:hypothetical protein